MSEITIHLPLPDVFDNISAQNWHHAVSMLEHQRITFADPEMSDRVRQLVEQMGKTRTHVQSVLTPQFRSRVGISWSPLRSRAMAEAPWIIFSGTSLIDAAQFPVETGVSVWKNRPGTTEEDCAFYGTRSAWYQLMYAEEHHHVYMQNIDPVQKEKGSCTLEKDASVALHVYDAHPHEFQALQFQLQVAEHFQMATKTIEVLQKRIDAALAFLKSQKS